MRFIHEFVDFIILFSVYEFHDDKIFYVSLNCPIALVTSKRWSLIWMCEQMSFKFWSWRENVRHIFYKHVDGLPDELPSYALTSWTRIWMPSHTDHMQTDEYQNESSGGLPIWIENWTICCNDHMHATFLFLLCLIDVWVYFHSILLRIDDQNDFHLRQFYPITYGKFIFFLLMQIINWKFQWN